MSGPNSAQWHHPWLLLMMALLVLGGLKGCIGAQASTPPICQKLLIPTYFVPGPLWDQVIAASGDAVGIIVLNPASGVGPIPDAAYQQAVNQAHRANIKVVGYMSTIYGTADQAALFQQIANYKSWYAVDGVFLDEVAIDVGHVGYYQVLADHIHAAIPGGKVILNPGVVPDEAYMSVGDIVIVFEGSYSTYVSQLFPIWLAGYPSSKIAHLIYDVSQGNLDRAVQLARQRNASYIYVTSDVPPNPWNMLPDYWNNMLPTACVEPTPTITMSPTPTSTATPTAPTAMVHSYYLPLLIS